jgi:hypothetical protein
MPIEKPKGEKKFIKKKKKKKGTAFPPQGKKFVIPSQVISILCKGILCILSAHSSHRSSI